MTGSLRYCTNPLARKPPYNYVDKVFSIVKWKRGDPFPQLGEYLGIDTETELITDTCQVPPLVVTGVYNPLDNTCYIIDYESTPAFMEEVLKRDSKIFFANAGFDYYELWSPALQQAASDRRIIDILIRGPLCEIATIGFILTYSLKDACKRYLKYDIDKHEDEGDQSVRLNFKQGRPLTDEEMLYLSLDCVTTYLAGMEMGPQATEDTHTLGAIVLTHIRNNGMEVDPVMFDYCENLLKTDMETYRQQLIQFGFPDPLKKKEKTEMELLEEGWRTFITEYWRQFYDESYHHPISIPNKGTCKRMILYGLNGMKQGVDKAHLARLLTALLIQGKGTLTKKETQFWDAMTEEDFDFLVPCDACRKREVWPILLKKFLDKFAEEVSYEGMKEALDEVVQEHADWFATETPVKAQDFLQARLKAIEESQKGMQFARTEKTGLLKCSKKDAWLLEDFDVHDAFLDCYNNFVHVQKYLSTFCNREHIKADGKVHPKFGMVATGRSSCSSPNVQQYPSHDSTYKLKNMFMPPSGSILVSCDYSFAELVSLAQNCLTKYGKSVLAEIINADVCPHYFFEGVILGLIKPDVSFCKDPEKVEEMNAFLESHITKDQRKVAKAVSIVDHMQSDLYIKESELLEGVFDRTQ